MIAVKNNTEAKFLAKTIDSLIDPSFNEGVHKLRICGALEGILIVYGKIGGGGGDFEFKDIECEGRVKFPYIKKTRYIRKENYYELIFRKAKEFHTELMFTNYGVADNISTNE